MKPMCSVIGTRLLLSTAPLWMGVSECKPEVERGRCDYAGERYDVGDRFSTEDGCNTCRCTESGAVECTERRCAAECEYDGEHYAPGSRFAAADGCNTCSCGLDGTALCTEVACPPQCEYEGTRYDINSTFAAADGCNRCTCEPDGSLSCTEEACNPDSCRFGATEFGLGDGVVCPDGCNQCRCIGGGWASTRIACGEPDSIQLCDPVSTPGESLRPVYVEDDKLAVALNYSGGCFTHSFKLCYDGTFLESLPVQARIWAVDTTGKPDPCDALPTVQHVFDLGPLKRAYQEAYQSQRGTIILQLNQGNARYEF